MKLRPTLLSLVAVLGLTACATERPKPKSWSVKTSTESQEKIWVAKPDGSVQCGAPRKDVLSPEEATLQLKGVGVIVFQARSVRDSRMRAQKCGAPTGNIVELEISKPDLRKALSQGYLSRQETARQ